MLSTDPSTIKEAGISDRNRARTALLYDLASWREQLARSIVRNNHGLPSDAIAAATYRIIGRFLFLGIAEDRGLLKSGTLRQIHDSPDPLAAVSELFLPIGDPWAGIPAKGRYHLTAEDPVIVEDRVIQKILVRLSQPDRQYHFGSVPNGLIAEVFDQHFTHVIRRSAAHQAVVVETSDTIQSQGTPTPSPEMIAFIVHRSLAGVFANRNPKDPLPVRVLDMACGSGRVLLSAYQHLLSRSISGRPTLAERQELLGNSIHGVDLDPHTIAAAKMLLFFELCDDRVTRVLPEQFFSLAGSVFRILDRNILCGNSLISVDVDSEDSIAFFPAHERHRIKPLDWQHSFPEVLQAGGFDAVLGNLPDGPLQPHEWVQRYFQRHYAVYHLKADRSAYFIERGLSLLCPGGMLGCVAGNRWLRAKSGSPLRKHMLAYQIEEIADSGTEAENKLHPSLCMLRVSRRSPLQGFIATRLDPESSEPLDLQVQKGGFPLDQTELGAGGWKLRDTRVQDILAKVSGAGTLLEDVVMGQAYHGIITGLDEAFVIDDQQRKELIRASPKSKSLIRPFLSAREIVRYGAPRRSRFIIFIPQGWTTSHAGEQNGWRWLRKKYPAVARHLKSYAERARERRHHGDFWWECSGEQGAFDQNRSRIIFPNSGKFPSFMFDTGAAIPDRRTGFIISSSLYLLAVLNSRLSAFIFNGTPQKNAEISRTPLWERIAALPIYTPDFDNPDDKIRHDRMVALVTEMLELHKHLSNAKTDQEKRLITQEIESTDWQIDSLVYGLYGLTADEIAVVEESIKK